MYKKTIILSLMILFASNTVAVGNASNSVTDTTSNAVAQSNSFFNRIFGNRGYRYNNSDRYDNDSNYRNRNRNGRNYNRESYKDNNQYNRQNRNNRRNNSLGY